MPATVPVSAVDVYDPEVVNNPFEVYDELRESGPVVYFEKYGVFALPRYQEVREALSDPEHFISGAGVGLTKEGNAPIIGTLLASDDPLHATLRAVLSEQLSPRELRKLGERLQAQADALVAEAVGLGTFDAITDLSARFPVSVVADLVGLPEEGREKLLPGANAIFSTRFGPERDDIAQFWPAAKAYVEYIAASCNRETLAPGSWGAAVLDAADENRLAGTPPAQSLSAILIAGMDTTVNLLGSFLRILAEQPQVWADLKADPSLISSGITETLRIESPVQGFYREVRGDVELGGHRFDEGDRVMVMFGAANRDPRQYENPAQFDLRRNPLDHLAFGYGLHGCVGQHLAKMEARALLTSLLAQVESIELAGTPEQRYNPVLRGLVHLPVRVTPAPGGVQ